MTNYKEMYYKLFNSITNVIEILQETQRETEDMYISSGDTDIILLNKKDIDKENSQ